jgi:hypothetical protein
MCILAGIAYSVAAGFGPLSASQNPTVETGFTAIFDGKTLNGWEGDPDYFRVEDGAIVAGSLERPTPENQFISSTGSFGDFELRLSFKLLGDPAHANAGVQFRSSRVPNSNEMSGYQADIGQTYWGCLYDESRRNRTLVQADQDAVNRVLRRDGWNDYVIRCEGRHIQLWLNGVQTVDYREHDSGIAESGLIGLQVHQGPPSKVFYRNIRVRKF